MPTNTERVMELLRRTPGLDDGEIARQSGGGLVIDERLYRRMESRHRRVVKASGGIAEILLRAAMVELADAAAIWGYVGDLLSEKVNVRVGLRRTAHRYLMVHWSKPLAQEDKDQRLARVAALGPF